MEMNHYFSKDPEKRAKFIFNLIAPVYGSLDENVKSGFEKTFNILNEEIIVNGKEVLDIGTGTGAWASLFFDNNAKKVTGIDFSEKMLIQAKKNHPGIDFQIADAKNLKEFKDNTFDIVTASFVLHGTKREIRSEILFEMKRVSSKYVIIHDFIGKTPFGIKILEWLERSDYINFKKTFSSEMSDYFDETKTIEIGGGTGLYIGIIN